MQAELGLSMSIRTLIVEVLSPENRITPDLVSALDQLRRMVEG